MLMYLLLFCCLLFSDLVLGQEKQTFNYNGDFNYEVEWTNDKDKYTIILESEFGTDTFSVEPLRPATFTTAFLNTFKSLLENSENPWSPKKEGENNNSEKTEKIDNSEKKEKTTNRIIHQANEVLFYIQAQSIADLDFRPKAGDIKITKEVTISKFTKNWAQTCIKIKKCGVVDTVKQKSIALDIANLDETERWLDDMLDGIEKEKGDKDFFLKKIRENLNSIEVKMEKGENETNLIKNIRIVLDSIEVNSPPDEDILINNAKNKINKLKNKLNCNKRTREDAINFHYRDRGPFLRTPKKQYLIKLLKDARNGQLSKHDGRLDSLKNDTLNIVEEILVLNKELRVLIAQEEQYDEKKVEFESIWSEISEMEKDTFLLKQKLSTLELRGKVLKRDYEEIKKVLSDEKERNGVDTLAERIRKLNSFIEIGFTTLDTFCNENDVICEEKMNGNDLRTDVLFALFGNIENRSKETLDKKVVDSFVIEAEEQLDVKYNDTTKLRTIVEKLTVFETEYNAKKAKKEKIGSKIKVVVQEIKSINQNTSSLRQDIEKKREMILDDFRCGSKKKCEEQLKFSLNEIKEKIKSKKDSLNQQKSYLLSLRNKIDEIKKNKKYEQPFIIDSIQVEFYEGFIENIWVVGHLKLDPKKSLKFENRSPIRFSSKKAYDRSNNIYLTASGEEDIYWVLYMGDLISYLQNHDNGTKDYSPANGTVVWTDSKKNKLEEAKSLYKKATSKVFEAHVFSDFVGFDEEAPNGLIQTEISKRFNIYTRRFGSFLTKDAVYCKCHGPQYGSNLGFLNFIRPSFVFSKFEQKKRNLELGVQNKIINGELQSIKFASTQHILQHEIFNIGAVVNGITLDMPLAKSVLYHNVGFAYGRTEVTDSIYQYKDNTISAVGANYYGINTTRLFAEIVYKITPEKRYGVETAIRFTWLKGFTAEKSFFQLNKLDKSDQIDSEAAAINAWMIRFQVSGFFRPSKDSDSKLFIRYRLHAQLDSPKYNFHQLQVGYSFYLLRSNIMKTKGPAASQ